MTPERWQRIKDIFAHASELPETARAAYLDQACAGDPDSRSEVETLLEAYAGAGEFIERPVLERRADLIAQFPDPAIGMRLGAWRILSLIGQGGMGTVYRAERADGHFQQQAAVKIVRRGMENEYILRRFRHERQILASLDHPNIGRLLDGGLTADGLPYFVMECIEGTRIDRYCDDKRLGVAGRIRLFLSVCSAVHHAHSKLVIHRDLKPANILITDAGIPKLLDFGIARILDPEIGSLTNEQSSGRMLVMTPEYASPEQIRGDLITTASDVYSLGVLLYELLTGLRPYRLPRSRPDVELAHAICTQDPPPPSASVTQEVPPDFRRGDGPAPPRELKHILAGDLDAIVLKAMRKVPRERFESAELLASDLRHYLDGKPVSARSYPLGFPATRFLSRYGLVAALAVVLAGGGLGVALWQNRRPAAASPSARGTLPANREAVRLYTAGMERLRLFDTTAARDLLDQAAKADPNHALTRTGLALALRSLGEDERGRIEAQRARELTRGLPREDVLFVEAHYAEAVNDWPKAIGNYHALHAVFPDNVDYGVRLASVQMRAGLTREALTTLEKLRQKPGPAWDDPRIDIEEANAAAVLGDRERQLRASIRAREVGDRRRSPVLVARARLSEGWALTALGRTERAILVLEESRRIYEGARHFRGVVMAEEALSRARAARR